MKAKAKPAPRPPRPKMFVRIRHKINLLRGALRNSESRAAEYQRRAQMAEARVKTLEERLNLYADSRATHELMRDSMELCIRVDLPTYKSSPWILDDVLGRLRSDFEHKAHRR